MTADIRVVREEAPLTDIPAMLRGLADLIEQGDGDYKDVREVVILRDCGTSMPPAIHAYGLTTAESTLRIICCAWSELVRMMSNGLGRISR